MKLKYIAHTTGLFTHGEIYETTGKVFLDGEGFYPINTLGGPYRARADRFESLNPIEEKKLQISDAKINLQTLEKELAEMTLPKKGQRYLNESGNKYVVCQSDSLFALVSYEGCNQGHAYGGVFHSNVANIFCGCEECFTLIED
jgi:hypothetical protein